jgi:acetylornithine deacetylase/succinyl-diaminopimelate desuccinylase-like protein
MRRITGFLLFVSFVSAQTNPASITARQYRESHERAIIDEYFQLLSIPNIASDQVNIRRNADFIIAMLKKRGVAARLVEAPDVNPVVFGEIRTPGATRTIVFYAHYDGQPLDPKEWASPPFSPVLRDKALDSDGRIIPLPTKFNPESRIYARSTGDDKAPIVALLAALDSGAKPKSNIKFVFEGEEEAGSPNLGHILEGNKALFSGDVWLICDGPVHQTRQQLIAFGARGIAQVDITVYGPRRELHSGHYGNWAPNPAMMLAKLLSSLKNDSGRVLIDHFYDNIAPLSNTEKKAIAEAPEVDDELKRELWLGSTEGSPKNLIELLQQPSLNIRGMASARVGAQASNVIPSTANATIDMRLVKGMDHKETVARFIEHVRKQGYFVVDSEPSAEVRMSHERVAKIVSKEGGYNAVRTSMDLPISQEVIRAVESARGPAVKVPTMGGSVPLEMIERAVGTHTIEVPIANHDDNQHTFNENIRIQNLWDGIEVMAALLTM